MLVCSSGNDRVNIYDPTSGEHKGDFTVDSPQDVVLYDGFLYVTSFGKDEVVKIDAADYARERALVASSSVFDRPRGITLGPDDLLYVVSYGTHSVVRFDPQADTYLDTFASSDVLTWPRFAQFGSDRNGDGYPELFVTNELSLFTTGVTVLDGNSGTFEFDDHSSGTHSRDLAFVPFTAVERPTVALRLNASQLSIANGDALEVTGILATGDDDVVLDILVWLRAEGEDPHWSTRLLEKPLPAELVIQRLVFAGIAGLGRVAEPGEYEFGLRVLDPRTGRLHSQAIVDLSILP